MEVENIYDVKFDRITKMKFHESIKCADGEIIRVTDGVLYIFIRRAQDGRKIYLPPVFVKIV